MHYRKHGGRTTEKVEKVEGVKERRRGGGGCSLGKLQLPSPAHHPLLQWYPPSHWGLIKGLQAIIHSLSNHLSDMQFHQLCLWDSSSYCTGNTDTHKQEILMLIKQKIKKKEEAWRELIFPLNAILVPLCRLSLQHATYKPYRVDSWIMQGSGMLWARRRTWRSVTVTTCELHAM